MIRPATFLVAAVFLQCSTVLHAQTEVPNTFEAGQPARASEVNDNFETLESAINQNTGILDQIQGTATLSNEARQIQTGLDLSSGLRWLIQQFYWEQGILPTDNPQVGVQAGFTWSNRFVSQAAINPNGAIVISFSQDASSAIALQQVSLVPTDPGSGVLWFDCVGDGVTDVFLSELPCAFSDEPYAPIAVPRSWIDVAFDVLRKSGAQDAVEDFYNANGFWPPDNAAAGLTVPGNFRNKYVTQLVVSDDVITITFGNDVGVVLDNREIQWVATDNVGIIAWECRAPTIEQRYLPPECRP